MRLCINDMLYALSYALDCVEHDLLGVTTYHGPRVAAISVAMGRRLGLTEQELMELAACAILHDNALTEYIQEEQSAGHDVLNDPTCIHAPSHCVKGEKNMKVFPFRTDVEGIVLYHHENADGTGAFGKRAGETPIGAQIIHLADQLDARFDLSFFSSEKETWVKAFLDKQRNKMFSDQCVTLFFDGCPARFLSQLHRERALVTVREQLPTVYQTYTQGEIIGICTVVARIIDYKSAFTKMHSLGIAQKALRMAKFYQLDKETQTKLYFAGALHDIGKLIVDSNILEKPAKLTDREYQHIQNHAYKTFEILKQIDGLGEVVGWAAHHHERLDGTGYPFGKKAGELGKMERLMACLDIYQALTEQRPYKKGMEHARALEILHGMASKNQVDEQIVDDIHRAFVQGFFTDECQQSQMQAGNGQRA